MQSRKQGECAVVKMMKAALVREFGRPLSIEQVPVPVPGPGEVLVKSQVTVEIEGAEKPALVAESLGLTRFA